MRTPISGMQMLNLEFSMRLQENDTPLRVDLGRVDEDLALPSPAPKSEAAWEQETRLLKILAPKDSDKDDDNKEFQLPDLNKADKTEEKKYQDLRKAFTSGRNQENRYKYIANSFAMNSCTDVYCLHDFTLAELCAAITGIRKSAQRDGVQKRIWINPPATLLIPESVGKSVKNTEKLIEIHAGPLSKTWMNILANLPSVKVAVEPDKRQKLQRAEERELSRLINGPESNAAAKMATLQDIKRTSLLPPIGAKNTANQKLRKEFLEFFHAPDEATKPEADKSTKKKPKIPHPPLTPRRK